GHAAELEGRGRGPGLQRARPQPLHGEGLRRLRDVGGLEDPAQGDSGVYLRGSPQVQIWDYTQDERHAVGSGGLFNNEKNPTDPLAVADRPIGQWNTFFIRMVGDKVTVYLNGKLVTDNVTMENYWDRKKP